MQVWVATALVAIGSYALGSVPFGILVTRLGGASDPRSIGSGNIGATNVLRTGRRGLALLTLLLDGGKGAAAVLATEALAPSFGPLAAVGAFLGHVFPLWLAFKGGKGVATYLGIAMALSWPCGAVAIAAWAVAALVTHYSSVAGMVAALAAPAMAALFARFDLVPLLLGLALILIWRHRDNLSRLVGGTEPSIGRKGSV